MILTFTFNYVSDISFPLVNFSSGLPPVLNYVRWCKNLSHSMRTSFYIKVKHYFHLSCQTLVRCLEFLQHDELAQMQQIMDKNEAYLEQDNGNWLTEKLDSVYQKTLKKKNVLSMALIMTNIMPVACVLCRIYIL